MWCICIYGQYRWWNIFYHLEYCWNTGPCLASDVLNSRKWLCRNGSKKRKLASRRENEESQCKQRGMAEAESEKGGDFHREWGMQGAWVRSAWCFLKSRNTWPIWTLSSLFQLYQLIKSHAGHYRLFAQPLSSCCGDVLHRNAACFEVDHVSSMIGFECYKILQLECCPQLCVCHGLLWRFLWTAIKLFQRGWQYLWIFFPLAENSGEGGP